VLIVAAIAAGATNASEATKTMRREAEFLAVTCYTHSQDFSYLDCKNTAARSEFGKIPAIF
jgi:hypothetical protein